MDAVSWTPPTTLMHLLLVLLVASFVTAEGSQALQYTPPPKGQPLAPIKLTAGKIVSSVNDAQVDIKAAVWGNTQSEPFSSFVRISRPEAPAASSNSSISRALVAAAYQLRQKGYNAVYLPFTFTDLHSDSSSSSKRIGSYVCRQLSLQDFVKKRDGNGFTGSSSSSTADAWKTKLVEQVLKDVTTAEVGSQQARKCLTLLPTTTTLDRYLWSVQWFLANGLYVIMSSSSNGVSPACGAATGGSSSSRSASCMQDAAAAADAWVKLWEAVLVLPAFEGSVHGRVMLQLAQEAGSTGQQWEPTSNSAGQEKLPGLQEVYLAIMDAVDRVQPGAALFILQGPQMQGPVASSQDKWGNGFTGDPYLISQGLSDPRPLFKSLVSKPYRNQIILAPRLFSAHSSRNTPSSPAMAASPAPAAAAEHMDGPPPDGPAPVKVFDNAVRQLSHLGFCVSEGNCHTFPVAVIQQQPSAADSGLQGKDAETDLELFVSFVLSKQSEPDLAPEDLATGNWYQWDILGDLA